MTQRIALINSDQCALVDNSDYELVAAHEWYAVRHGNTVYAATDVWEDGVYAGIVYMHDMIMDRLRNSSG
ncbi:hypothetical protein [Streptomyces sp. NPDC005407]|uniref:hypothetical protein n=1 Tax=Streptomyces sp. NPDC005407 TaxID=3155340 RepID=UPI0033A84BB1